MITLKLVKPAFFDCDSTIIEWRPSEDRKEEEGTECNWSIRSMAVDESGKIVMKEGTEEDVFIPIQSNIDQLKEHKRRGHSVVVWSAGGAEWAAQAVKMLGIEDYVDLAVDKPASLYDDKDFEQAFPKIQFVKDEPRIGGEKLSKKEYRGEAMEDSPYETAVAAPARPRALR